MKILKKNKLKILNFTTELILSILLLSIFSISFYLSSRLNPLVKNESDSVLGINSRELKLVDDVNIFYDIENADDSNLETVVNLEGLKEKIVNDYKFIEVKNPNDYPSKYILYFEIDENDFENVQLLLVNDINESVIYEARSTDPRVIDQTIEINPKSLVRFSLRTISLSEEIPDNIQFKVKVKLISSESF